MRRHRLIAGTFLCAATIIAAGPVLAQTACTDLNNASLTLDGGAVVLGIQAQDIPAGAIPSAPFLPAFCQVNAVISSNGNPAQSQIVVSVWMPEANWNHRFLGTGNGGFAGSISGGSLVLGLAEGYAVANTDMGTGNLFNCNGLYCGSQEGVAQYPNQTPGGLYGDDAAIEDFGYGATHLMTQAGQQLVAAYYGQAATHSYFHGCSTGGQQALMEAQRFPNDYDGILAGSPAYDRTHLHIASAAGYLATHFAPDAAVPPDGLELAHLSMLAQCAGTDGGLATDDYLTRPPSCTFDATVLECTGAQGEVPCTDPNGTSCTCLTGDQALAVNADWTGAKDSKGHVLYPGYERGTEEPAAGVFLEQEQVGEPLFDSLDYWAFGPSFDWHTLFANTTSLQGELSNMIAALDNTPVGSSTFAGVLNANSADLSAFSGHGGKLIMYAGYEDPLIPTASTIDYANALYARDANAGSYAKLFLAPGMWHCSGGPGANAFGNLSNLLPPIPTVPGDDVLGALVAWVENGISGSRIIATKYVNDDSSQGIAFQRPLCAYPMVAVYKPKLGSPLSANSFMCEARALVKKQSFGKIYGPN